MLRRALSAALAISLASLSAASLADDIKPKEALSAFTAKLRPDILGISMETSAEAARAMLESAFKGRVGTRIDIQQSKFGGGATSHVAALTFDLPPSPKQSGEVLSAGFSAPASANRAFVIARNLTFAQDQQPARAEMIKQAMDKYGAPTLVGDQHLYYIYRGGRIVSVGASYKAETALDAIDRPLDPRAAIKLNGPDGKGSCVAVAKRLQAREKTLSAMLDEAKGAYCDGALSVQLTPGIAPDRIGTAQFTLLDFKRIVSAAAIDAAALAAEANTRNPAPQGSVPKL
jgi:hypothetical protein